MPVRGDRCLPAVHWDFRVPAGTGPDRSHELVKGFCKNRSNQNDANTKNSPCTNPGTLKIRDKNVRKKIL
jgi:hypothetical protein